MKTYFMAWESDNKRGHSIHDFSNDTTPREALSKMIDAVVDEFTENVIPLAGIVSANQFNEVT